MTDATTPALPLERPLVIGLARAGQAVCSALIRRGHDVVVIDDHPSNELRARAESLGVTLVEAPPESDLRALVEGASIVLPSPGVPDRHPVFALAAQQSVPVASELDLARCWDSRPVVAITGTDGKTTVTTMVTEMLAASGTRVIDAGNNDLPLVTAIDDPDIDVFVVEASSFRLGHSRLFAPEVGTWLNFADDHLDVHASVDAYEQAKAAIWARLPADGVAVANADDPVVMRHAPAGRTRTFGLEARADWHVADGVLRTEDGDDLLPVGELPRALPHDLANALAASATAIHGGASLDGAREVLATFTGLAHRVQLVGEAGGIRWYDDAKSTAPHATLAAVRSFDAVVLVAGGRNKGLDLSVLTEAGDRIRAVVAIGEAADEVHAAFAGRCPVRVVHTDMDDAVRAAADLAKPGDSVLLSPACASFDWFSGYVERGEVFTAAVRRLVLDEGSGQ